MAEHLEQKFLSDDAIDSSGVSLFITALYTLDDSQARQKSSETNRAQT
jgi:hypothetical protein